MKDATITRKHGARRLTASRHNGKVRVRIEDTTTGAGVTMPLDDGLRDMLADLCDGREVRHPMPPKPDPVPEAEPAACEECDGDGSVPGLFVGALVPCPSCKVAP